MNNVADYIGEDYKEWRYQDCIFISSPTGSGKFYFVFADKTGNYIPQRSFMRKYHDFLKRYNITDIRFHDLRHTFATLLIESDVSMKVVQELLGHSTITTSMDIYTHVSDKKRNKH